VLKENAKAFKKLTIFADLCVVAACFFAGYFLIRSISASAAYPLKYYYNFLILFVFLWGWLLNILGMYDSFRTKRIPDILFTIAEIAMIGIGLFGIFLYFFNIEYVSRFFLFLVFGVTAAAVSAEKIILVTFFRYIRKYGYNTRNILIIGTGARARHFIDLVNTHAEWGLKILGLVDEDPARKGEAVNGSTVLGSLEDVPSIVHNNVVDEVIFIVPRSWLDRIEKVMRFCDTEGLNISVAVDYFELKFSKAKQTELNGFPLLTFRSAPDRIWHLMTKRSFDVMCSAISLILLSPVFLIIAVMVKRASEGPVFFRQERIGLNGRKFILYKFRTMVNGAEAKLNELKANNEMNGPVFKMANDPRITKAGRLLRKLSLDELPQLWNVLKGDMSMVGPRPPLLSEVVQYDNWQRRRLSMRPGLTCLWQIKGRNRITDFDEWMRLDLEYIDNWSLLLDLKIFLLTVPVVLFGIGAK